MPNRVNITGEKLQEYAERYNAGEIYPKLAAEAGCSVPTLIRKLKNLGVHSRKPGRASKIKWETSEGASSSTQEQVL